MTTGAGASYRAPAPGSRTGPRTLLRLEVERMEQGIETAPAEGAHGRGLRNVAVRGLETAAILVMAVEVVVVLAGGIFRYVLNRPIAGADEIADLLLVWLTFIGGAVAQPRRSHPD